MARTILVGDLHACPTELCELLEKVRYAQGVDRLILVGDLVARGPESAKAVEKAMEFGAQSVRGNHDERVLSWWRIARIKGPKEADRTAPVSARHRAVAAQLHDGLFAYLDALPLSIALPQHGSVVVHAGVDPYVPLDRQEPFVLLNIRSVLEDGSPSRGVPGTPWAKVWKGPPHLVFGHDARRGIQLEPWATGLDSGCCYGRELTALVLDEDEPMPHAPEERQSRMVCVAARKTYCPTGDGNGPE